MTNQAPFIKQTLFVFSYFAHDPWSMNLGGGAPNGIRTRVAALKGRCPRPLDDGDTGLEI